MQKSASAVHSREAGPESSVLCRTWPESRTLLVLLQPTSPKFPTGVGSSFNFHWALSWSHSHWIRLLRDCAESVNSLLLGHVHFLARPTFWAPLVCLVNERLWMLSENRLSAAFGCPQRVNISINLKECTLHLWPAREGSSWLNWSASSSFLLNEFNFILPWSSSLWGHLIKQASWNVYMPAMQISII